MSATQSRRASEKRIAPFHPILFALYPFLFLSGLNYPEARVGEVLSPAAVGLVCTLVALVLCRWVLGGWPRSALFVSLALWVFFSYGHIYSLLQGRSVGPLIPGRHRYLLAIAALVLGIGYVLAKRWRGDLGPVTRVANLTSICLVVVSIGSLAVKAATPVQTWLPEITDEEKAALAGASAARDRPDVYYLVLDGYGRADVLDQLYGFSNSPFLEALSRHGFEVLSGSRSNYATTLLSLASTLNMDYLGGDDRQIESDETLRQMIRNNKVGKLFELAGYRVVHATGSFAEGELTQIESAAPCGSGSSFLGTLIPTTLLRPFHAPVFYYFFARRREQLLCHLQSLSETISGPGPKFVLFHLMAPHPPFVVEADGAPRRGLDMSTTNWVPRAAYVEQLKFVNREILSAIGQILSRSAQDPIIIVQGDHGPASTAVAVGREDGWVDSELFLNERFPILNALFLPSYCKEPIVSTRTPVNTFRLIFSLCMGLSLPVIEDRALFSEGKPPYLFRDVSDRVWTGLAERDLLKGLDSG
jgi:hypothetical protein